MRPCRCSSPPHSALLLGVAQLVASVVGGALWSWVGPASTFVAGAAFSSAAAAGLRSALPEALRVAHRIARARAPRVVAAAPGSPYHRCAPHEILHYIAALLTPNHDGARAPAALRMRFV